MTTLPFGRPLTRYDLDGLPDDGHRDELIDGVLVVSPSPRPAHQLVKRDRFESAGVRSYWLVDPDAVPAAAGPCVP